MDRIIGLNQKDKIPMQQERMEINYMVLTKQIQP
jgi:hypothetical protein